MKNKISTIKYLSLTSEEKDFGLFIEGNSYNGIWKEWWPPSFGGGLAHYLIIKNGNITKESKSFSYTGKEGYLDLDITHYKLKNKLI